MDKVMERVRNLEKLVKELSSELEQAHSFVTSSTPTLTSISSGSLASSPQFIDGENQKEVLPGTVDNDIPQRLGRLVVEDVGGSRYVGSNFWSRVNDELAGLSTDTSQIVDDEYEFSEGEASPEPAYSTKGVVRTSSDQYGFLFRHNLSSSAPDLSHFRPQPSQIPFLLDVCLENVNVFTRILHVPTITKMARNLRGTGMARQIPSNEVLMFSIYYSAVISMEDEDVSSNFGTSKAELSQKYRLGLEYALAKADFLNAPDLAIVQAMTLFLLLARRHDSPKFIWMMTGLLIRMAHYLGLQRDGSNFGHLSPFETHIRRALWWAICFLDVRASEDQGTALSIPRGTFDTKTPLNINDSDIDPQTKDFPPEHRGFTDMSFPRNTAAVIDVHHQLMAPEMRANLTDLNAKIRVIDKVYDNFQEHVLQYTHEANYGINWATATVARVVMAKLTLISFLPLLFVSPSENFTEEMRTKLLFAAIELSEHHHALNSEPACRNWRWLFQTRTHWHAIVYLVIEIPRRRWSPVVERAWVALHSRWLMPAEVATDKNYRIWVPIHKMIKRVNKHRQSELNRLRADPQAAAMLEQDDDKTPFPIRSGPFALKSSVEIFRKQWRDLISLPHQAVSNMSRRNETDCGTVCDGRGNHVTTQSRNQSLNGQQLGHIPFTNSIGENEYDEQSHMSFSIDPSFGTFYDPLSEVPDILFNGHDVEHDSTPAQASGFTPSNQTFPSTDTDLFDIDMELEDNMDWYSWIESVKSMEANARTNQT